MTQKQGLQNLMQSIDNREARYILVMNWLEDINWHTECSILNEHYKALEPDFTREQAVHTANRSENIAQYDFKVANEAPSTFSKIFGYGIDPQDWKSEGTGEAFVNELEALINDAQ